MKSTGSRICAGLLIGCVAGALGFVPLAHGATFGVLIGAISGAIGTDRDKDAEAPQDKN